MNTDKLVSIMATLIILTSWYVALDTIAVTPKIINDTSHKVYSHD